MGHRRKTYRYRELGRRRGLYLLHTTEPSQEPRCPVCCRPGSRHSNLGATFCNECRVAVHTGYTTRCFGFRMCLTCESERLHGP